MLNKKELLFILNSKNCDELLKDNLNNLPFEIQQLDQTEQDPTWHPEGNAFVHTCLVVKAMNNLQYGMFLSDKCDLLLVSALLHDIGKAICTFYHEKKQKIVSYGHDVKGVPIAQKLMKDWSFSEDEINFVSSIVRWHMSHTVKTWTKKSVEKLVNNLFPANMSHLMYMMMADCAARPPLSPDLPDSIKFGLVPIYNDLYGAK